MAKIIYLRHGDVLTGGAQHEEFLVDELNKFLPGSVVEKKIKAGIFRGLNNLTLFFWGWRNANAEVNVVVARLALSSLIRNLFSNRKTIIILHYFDLRDGKSFLLKWYYNILFCVLKNSSPQKVSVVAVSPFFQKFFREKFPKLNVFLFPNFFDAEIYKNIKSEKNNKMVFMGQYSFKLDNNIFSLATKLKGAGYEPWFCTMRQKQEGDFGKYKIIYDDFQGYLTRLKSSYVSVAFTGINEGWNRIAHESILLGVPVIGYATGGLGDLLHESNSYIVKNMDEAYELITSYGEIKANPPETFIAKYQKENAEGFILPLVKFTEL